MPKPPDLDSAYALKSPADSQRLYKAWADTYDREFIAKTGYTLADRVAERFAGLGGAGPVLDIGAGTGSVGVALALHSVSAIHGVDISPDMLEQARQKGCYDKLFVTDLTQGLDLPDASYQGVTSAGTFTHGHLGPEVLPELLRVAVPGALFVLSINSEHFETRGFSETFSALGDRIQGLPKQKTLIYERNSDTAHKNDTALITAFRKA